MKYHDQLKHPLWQRKRLEVLENNNYTCADCGSTDTTLHVHHPYYTRGAMLWDYEWHVLQCLCEVCHTNAHAIDVKLRKALAACSGMMEPTIKMQILGYIDGLVMPPSNEYLEDEDYRYGYADAIRGNTDIIFNRSILSPSNE